MNDATGRQVSRVYQQLEDAGVDLEASVIVAGDGQVQVRERHEFVAMARSNFAKSPSSESLYEDLVACLSTDPPPGTIWPLTVEKVGKQMAVEIGTLGYADKGSLSLSKPARGAGKYGRASN